MQLLLKRNTQYAAGQTREVTKAGQDPWVSDQAVQAQKDRQQAFVLSAISIRMLINLPESAFTTLNLIVTLTADRDKATVHLLPPAPTTAPSSKQTLVPAVMKS